MRRCIGTLIIATPSHCRGYQVHRHAGTSAWGRTRTGHGRMTAGTLLASVGGGGACRPWRTCERRPRLLTTSGERLRRERFPALTWNSDAACAEGVSRASGCGRGFALDVCGAGFFPALSVLLARIGSSSPVRSRRSSARCGCSGACRGRDRPGFGTPSGATDARIVAVSVGPVACRGRLCDAQRLIRNIGWSAAGAS
jgi:hypothetical protein